MAANVFNLVRAVLTAGVGTVEGVHGVNQLFELVHEMPGDVVPRVLFTQGLGTNGTGGPDGGFSAGGVRRSGGSESRVRKKMRNYILELEARLNTEGKSAK